MRQVVNGDTGPRRFGSSVNLAQSDCTYVTLQEQETILHLWRQVRANPLGRLVAIDADYVRSPIRQQRVQAGGSAGSTTAVDDQLGIGGHCTSPEVFALPRIERPPCVIRMRLIRSGAPLGRGASAETHMSTTTCCRGRHANSRAGLTFSMREIRLRQTRIITRLHLPIGRDDLRIRT